VANLLLFLAGGVLLGRGLTRPFGSRTLRAKSRSILTALSVAGREFFVFGVFYEFSSAGFRRQRRALDRGAGFHVAGPKTASGDARRTPLLAARRGKRRASGVLLIFYRGHW